MGLIQAMEEKDMVAFLEEHSELLQELDGIDMKKLATDLAAASKIKLGWFKNGIGDYMYVKGVVVSNKNAKSTILGRSGAVLIHWATITHSGIHDWILPVAEFPKFDSISDTSLMMHETTREDFEQAAHKMADAIVSEDSATKDPVEVLSVVKAFNKIVAMR